MKCDPEHSEVTAPGATATSLVITNARVFDGRDLLTGDTVAVLDGVVAAVPAGCRRHDEGGPDPAAVGAPFCGRSAGLSPPVRR